MYKKRQHNSIYFRHFYPHVQKAEPCAAESFSAITKRFIRFHSFLERGNAACSVCCRSYFLTRFRYRTSPAAPAAPSPRARPIADRGVASPVGALVPGRLPLPVPVFPFPP